MTDLSTRMQVEAE